MGSFMGHILPGMLFLIAGFWFAFKYPYRFVLDKKNSVVVKHNASQLYKQTGRGMLQLNRIAQLTPGHCSIYPIQFMPGYFIKTKKRKKLCGCRCNLDVIEGCAKIILSSIGILAEQFANDGPEFRLTDPSNKYQDGNVWSHCTMYLFFLLAGCVDCLTLKFLRWIPRGAHYLAMGLAGFIEGYLFYFHTHGREELDVRIHVLLLLAIWGGTIASMMLGILQAIYAEGVKERVNLNDARTEYVELLSNDVDVETTTLDENNLPDNDAQHKDKSDSNNVLTPELQVLFESLQTNIVRSSFFDGSQLRIILQLVFTATILLQGTWFCQIATILYPPGKSGWDRSAHENIQFATIFFAWHLAFVVVIVSVIYFFVGFITVRQREMQKT